jgi:hypothetical protein
VHANQGTADGGGAIYTSGPNLRTIKHFFIDGKLKVGTSAAPKGIGLFDTVDGSEHCIQVNNNVLVLSNGECP